MKNIKSRVTGDWFRTLRRPLSMPFGLRENIKKELNFKLDVLSIIKRLYILNIN